MVKKMFDFKIHGDERGSLVAIESIKDIPFEIKRLYYIVGTSGDVRRGFHAHKKLEQILICLSGGCKILLDDGNEKTTVSLNKFNEGLYIGAELWHEMFDFEIGTVFLAIASDYYDEADYLRDYNDFLKYIKEGETE